LGSIGPDPEITQSGMHCDKTVTETTLINPNKTNSHHRRNPANPRMDLKLSYKKDDERVSIG